MFLFIKDTLPQKCASFNSFRIENFNYRLVLHLFMCSHVLTVGVQLTCSALSCVCTASLMSTVYEEEKDEDGFLYITYSGENTFGSGSSLEDAREAFRVN